MWFFKRYNQPTTKMRTDQEYFDFMDELIERGIHLGRYDDPDRVRQLKANPEMFDKISSVDFLRKVAKRRYSGKENAKDIIQVLEESFSSDQFKNDLKNVIHELKKSSRQKNDSSFDNAELELRIVLQAFNDAQKLSSYRRPGFIME